MSKGHAGIKFSAELVSRNLNLDQNQTLAIFVPGIDHAIEQHLVAGIEGIAYGKGYSIFLCVAHNDPDRERMLLEMVRERKVTGLVLTCSSLEGASFASLQETEMPFVYVGESHGFLMCDRCYIDYEEGAYRMVSHLLKMNPLALEEGGFHLFLDQEKTGRIRQREEGSWRALEEARGAVEHGIPQKTQQLERRTFRLVRCFTRLLRRWIFRLKNGGWWQLVCSQIAWHAQGAPQELALQSVLKIRQSCGNRRVILELRNT